MASPKQDTTKAAAALMQYSARIVYGVLALLFVVGGSFIALRQIPWFAANSMFLSLLAFIVFVAALYFTCKIGNYTRYDLYSIATEFLIVVSVVSLAFAAFTLFSVTREWFLFLPSLFSLSSTMIVAIFDIGGIIYLMHSSWNVREIIMLFFVGIIISFISLVHLLIARGLIIEEVLSIILGGFTAILLFYAYKEWSIFRQLRTAPWLFFIIFGVVITVLDFLGQYGQVFLHLRPRVPIIGFIIKAASEFIVFLLLGLFIEWYIHSSLFKTIRGVSAGASPSRSASMRGR